MNPDEFAALDATAQADLVRRREVTPRELVDAAIARIERLNPALNAVITPLFEQARAAAATPLPDGPFSGVPFLLKDLVASYGGTRMTGGAGVLRDYVSPHDSELVRRYKRAGLVILGKTNTPEFGIPPTTEPVAYGPTRNPWNRERTPGGSSGGSGAAVAARMVAMAHGNDGGGSIRIPSSCCGIFGLKPTRGRNPLGPDQGDMVGGLICEHALTVSVRDSAALLDATAGPDAGDPYCAPAPARPFRAEVDAPPGRLRIAFSVQAPTGTTVHPDCQRSVRDAAALCAELGHDVEERAPEIDAVPFVRAFMAVYAASAAKSMASLERQGLTPRREQFEPITWGLYEMGLQVNAGAYLLAVEDLQRTAREVARFYETHDLWLTPVLAEPPWPLGTLDATWDDPLRGFFRASELCAFTPICNATGQPAMSVPLYWNADGLPLGAHFMARFGDEATLFRLAAQLEEARPWAKRMPPHTV
ncbi:MAG TPA: amidase family protein [Candidatus Binatia bacterium]